MGYHHPVQLGTTQNVIPVRVGVDDRARPGYVLPHQRVQELPRMSARRPGVQHEGAAITHDRADRWTVRRAGRHPIDVLADLREFAHRPSGVSAELWTVLRYSAPGGVGLWN